MKDVYKYKRLIATQNLDGEWELRYAITGNKYLQGPRKWKTKNNAKRWAEKNGYIFEEEWVAA